MFAGEQPTSLIHLELTASPTGGSWVSLCCRSKTTTIHNKENDSQTNEVVPIACLPKTNCVELPKTPRTPGTEVTEALSAADHHGIQIRRTPKPRTFCNKDRFRNESA